MHLPYKNSNRSFVSTLETAHQNQQKCLAMLLDPDKIDVAALSTYLRSKATKPDFLLLGGSLLTQGSLAGLIDVLKPLTSIPLVIFPGNYLQIDGRADAFWLLSLVSGRNPEYLIGQHVVAAPLLAKSNLEVIPVAYLLIESGRTTAVEYISQTRPLPAHKPELTACTALAAAQLGMRLVYLEGGSGALNPVPEAHIKAVTYTVDVPLVVGGGIRTPEQAKRAWSAGATVVVVGSASEDNLGIMNELALMRNTLNANG